jgi:DDE superfamily endonuclease
MVDFIVTADFMLMQGLLMVGFDHHRIQKVLRNTNIIRFRSFYGSDPIVYARIWNDLHDGTNEAAFIHTSTATLRHFFMSLFFLKCYPSATQMAAIFRVCEKTARKWCWYFLSKIQALKHTKVTKHNNIAITLCTIIFSILYSLSQITWPTQWTQGHPDFCQADLPVFLLTVDGVHCRIEEPQHPTKSKDPSYYSHKFRTAGVDYELGLSVFNNKLVWINGPMKASRHDVTVFRRAGLRAMIPDGHRVIGDSGYAGEPTVVSTPNAHDPVMLRRFKSRARARHEAFNGRIKNFKCLDERFRHSLKYHKGAFEATCVIVQYQIENGSPLFDV